MSKGGLFAKVAHFERQFEHALDAPKPVPRTAPPAPVPPARAEPAALRTAALRSARPKPLVTVQIPPKAQATRTAPDPAGAAFGSASRLSPAGAKPVSLTAKALKTTLVLDAAMVAAIDLVDGQPAPPFVIAAGGRKVKAQVSAKGLRKVLGVIGEHGPDHVAVILQGKLTEGDVLAEAGLVAQVRSERTPPCPPLAQVQSPSSQSG